MAREKIAVILPLRRENPEKLRKCLSALVSQKGVDCSVFVVLDRDADSASVSVAEEFREKVEIVRTRGKTVSELRDNCLSLPEKFDYFAFTDPDCVPGKNWLYSLKHGLPEGFSAIGGSDPFERKPGIFNKFMRGDIESRLGKRGETYWLDTNNFLVKAREFRQVGGFKNDLTKGTDTFISEKLARSGKRMFFDPKIAVIHMKDYSFGSFVRECVKYGKSHAEIFLSGIRFSRTVRSHPGILYFIQPAIAGSSVLALPIVPAVSLALVSSLFAIGIAKSFQQSSQNKLLFSLIFSFRPFLWFFGGISGALSHFFQPIDSRKGRA